MITEKDLIEFLVTSGAEIKREDINVLETFEDMGLDSLDVFNFFTEIESEIGLDVPDEDFDTLQTIKDVKDYINNHNH